MTTEKISRQCPSCGEKGKSVSSITVSSNLSEKAKGRLNSAEGFTFCPNRNCDVSYFGSQTFRASDVRQLIFQKSTDSTRLVCYCFKHSVAEIEDEILTTGQTDVLASIRDQCKKGLDECEKNNPQGSCCLGNVTRVIRSAPATTDIQKIPREDSACCETSDESK